MIVSVWGSLTGLPSRLTINLKTPKPCDLPYRAIGFALRGNLFLRVALRGQSQGNLTGLPLTDINLKPSCIRRPPYLNAFYNLKNDAPIFP